MPARPSAEEAPLRVQLQVRGSGRASVDSGLDALDELLEVLTRAARFDLDLAGGRDAPDEGRIDRVGRALGYALAEALVEPGAARIGSAEAPQDEALAHVVLEASGRPLVVSNVDLSAEHVGGVRGDLVARLLDALAAGAGLTVHVRLLHGEDTQHVIDAIAKALGLALADACSTR